MMNEENSMSNLCKINGNFLLRLIMRYLFVTVPSLQIAKIYCYSRYVQLTLD